MFFACIAANTILAQSVTYGLLQDSDNLLRLQAVAYPDFDSDNVTISTAVFTLLMPAGLETTAHLAPAPETGSFEDLTGNWDVQVITPEVYNQVGLDGASLKSYDVYQIVLQNSPELDEVRIDEPIPLFAFELEQDCAEGFISVLQNNSDVQQAIFADLRANFNNQMSISYDDQPSRDIYRDNDPFSFELACPLGEMVSTTTAEYAKQPAQLYLQPNPAKDYTDAMLKLAKAQTVTVELLDVSKTVVFQQKYDLAAGKSSIRLDLSRLAPATYILNVRTQEESFQKKVIKSR
jgi:hypothetical protein